MRQEAVVDHRAIDPAAIGDWRARVGFRLGGDRFVASVGGGELTIVRGEPDDVDVVLDTDTATLVRIVHGKWPLGEAEAAALATLAGERAVWDRFATLFALPAKLDE